MLFIGIYFNECFSASIGQEKLVGIDARRSPQRVADALAKHNCNGYPDEILVVQHDDVVEHWSCGKNFIEEKHDNG